MTKKSKTIKLKKKPLLIIVLITVISIISFVFFFNHTQTKATDNLQTLAQKILEKCKDAKDRANCYNKEIPNLMDKPTSLSMEDSFTITKYVQEKDPSFAFCHVLGHELSAKEVRKDRSKWTQVLTRCPSGVCSNGCLHGGLQERFRSESLSDKQTGTILPPDLETICEARDSWQPTHMEQASCYHAVGHLLMYITKADAQKASTYCEIIAKKEDERDFTKVCFDGVFMQIFQPLDPEDFELVKGKQPTKQTVDGYCNGFTGGAQKASCQNESWPLFFAEVTTPQGLLDFCGKVENEYQDRCFSALFYILPVQFRFELPTIRTFCQGLPREKGIQCFSDTATRMIETDFGNTYKALALCEAAKEYFKSNACYENLATFAKYNFLEDSEEKTTFCSSLPGAWLKTCSN